MRTHSTPSPADVGAADEPQPDPAARPSIHPAPLRIAACTAAGGWPGAGIGITRLLAGLDRLGHAVRLYHDDPGVRARAADLGVLARRQPLGGDLSVLRARRFAAELQRRGPDVLVAAGRRTLGAGVMAARRAEVDRVIAWIDLETDLPRTARDRFPFGRGVDAVVVPTASMRRRVRDALPDFRGDVVAIAPGVRPPVPRGGVSQRALLGVPLGVPLLGSVGPLVERKRFDRFIRVLAALPTAHGLVVGEGPSRRRLERLAGRFGVADRLHLAGFQADIGPALDAMDVYVVTSDAEGLSRAMLEAMSVGLPVVSTPVSGSTEALEAGVDGSREPGVVAGMEVDALVAALRALLADRSRLRAIGQAAQRVARERFDEATMLAGWDAVLAGRSDG